MKLTHNDEWLDLIWLPVLQVADLKNPNSDHFASP
jgi:hypothetical protein